MVAKQGFFLKNAIFRSLWRVVASLVIIAAVIFLDYEYIFLFAILFAARN